MEAKRTFIPGGEWIYFKLYTGIITADKILVDQVKPFVDFLKKHHLIKQYFFVRYRDPEFHLRLRLRLNSCDSYTDVFHLFSIDFLI